MQSMHNKHAIVNEILANNGRSMGYDISDYQKPSAHYGTLADVDAIIKGCHDRGLKILFDLGRPVVNTQSDVPLFTFTSSILSDQSH